MSIVDDYGAPTAGNGDAGSLAAALAAAIRAACAARGDTDANRDALLAECLQLKASHQLDLLAHFRAVAQMAPLSPPSPGAAAPARKSS